MDDKRKDHPNKKKWTETMPEEKRISYTLINTSLRRAKRDEKNISIAWIDFKKTSDIVPQSWIIDCLKMYKISDEVINFIENTMENWRV